MRSVDVLSQTAGTVVIVGYNDPNCTYKRTDGRKLAPYRYMAVVELSELNRDGVTAHSCGYGTTTRPITVGETVFVDGVQKYAEIKIAANVPVMIRHNKRPVGEHYAMDVSALLFQTQNPDQQHVPILDLVNKDGSRAHLASTGSSNSRWPSVSRIGGNKKA